MAKDWIGHLRLFEYEYRFTEYEYRFTEYEYRFTEYEYEEIFFRCTSKRSMLKQELVTV